MESEIQAYLQTLPEPKRRDMQRLHERMLQLAPDCTLWFLDGKDATGKVVSNPNIGYGLYTITYADGASREFYRVGLSANTGGISVYIMGLDDKTFLADTYGPRLGKAKITGYCIRFRKLDDVDLGVLEEAVMYGLRRD